MVLSEADRNDLKTALKNRDSTFWLKLRSLGKAQIEANDLVFLSKLSKSALRSGIENPFKNAQIKIGVTGGYTFQPLVNFIDFYLCSYGIEAQFHLGEYDNYPSEILDPKSSVHSFKPDFMLFFPSEKRHFFQGSIIDTLEDQKKQIVEQAETILNFSERLHHQTKATILIANFKLPNEAHLGAVKHRGLFSDWNFRKLLNLELGLRCRHFESIVDTEFLSALVGVSTAEDARAWYETKQIGSSTLLARLAFESAEIIKNHGVASKKVIVLDLDNTLWGGVIGDDDIQGIELGDTSARGEAYKDFQKFIRKLKARGFLLAVCSKNENLTARRPFLEHPDMVLKLEDIISFKANWNSKADNLNEIAQELKLGLESMIFIDDNPAEIEIVKQFLPQVSTIQLTSDPSDSIGLLNASGFFYQHAITNEDLEKTEKYLAETERQSFKSGVTDMATYLGSLNMRAVVSDFKEVDAPRIAQLISKSNQFNLTTRRRTEAEIRQIINSSIMRGFTVRLFDRFGDYGLIAVVIAELGSKTLMVDTLLMSCRVLERGVEQEIFNKLQKIAIANGLEEIVGEYIPTSKNAMVRDLYLKYGFDLLEKTDSFTKFNLSKTSFQQIETAITVEEA